MTAARLFITLRKFKQHEKHCGRPAVLVLHMEKEGLREPELSASELVYGWCSVNAS